jgi:prepilin-type N-terminal cleavage/methylation domain-containing protein/prepilin-type processing-associated H-X9-DG protein
MMGRRIPKAFTLVELLVVIAVIGVLLALLLPALGMAREAARRSNCGSNLRQLGVGLHTYLTSNNCFPPGYISEVRDDHDDGGPGWSWCSMLLPFVEQQQLFKGIRHDKPIADPTNESVRMTSLALFVCPSDGEFQSDVEIPRKPSGAPVCRMAASNYIGSAGSVRPTCKTCRDYFDGVFGRNKAITPKNIRDGFSQTLAAGERAFHWSSPVWLGVPPDSKLVDRQNIGKFAAGPGYVLGTTFKDGFNIEKEILDDDEELSFSESFGSRHPGGANFLCCDGGVRFIWETIDPDVMNKLSTRSGNPKGAEIIHDSPF